MNLLSLPYLELIFGSSVFSWIFSKRTRPYLIAACNAVFLYLLRARVQDWAYVLILTGVVYLCSLIAEKTKKRKVFDGIGIGFAIVVLALYKYYLPSVGFLMPLGISFYTFKALSYLADHIGKKAEFHANPVYRFGNLCKAVFREAYRQGVYPEQNHKAVGTVHHRTVCISVCSGMHQHVDQRCI